MLTSLWLMGVATLLVADVPTRALPQKDAAPRRCYHCAANATACAGAALAVVECSGARPLCATSAVSPNFTSELSCAAAQKTSCSLTSATNAYALVCTCADDLCNAPFFKDVQKHLLDFTASNFTTNNSSDYTEAFFKLHFQNVTEEKMYKTLTVETVPATEKPVLNVSQPTAVSVAVTQSSTTVAHPVEVGLPRAEAFKHEPTALSEDDEDAGEGSGAYEEPRAPRPPAADPADPSSFLPANENDATPLRFTLSFTLPILFLYTIA